MAKNDNLSDFFLDLAKAIRYKRNETEETRRKPTDMAEAIRGIDKTKNGYFASNITCNIPEGVKGIKKLTIFNVDVVSEGAYNNCTNLEEVVFLGDTKEIKDTAFNGCSNLKTINIPNSLEYVGLGAFVGTIFYSNFLLGPVILGKALYVYRWDGTSIGDITIDDVDIVSISPGAFSSVSFYNNMKGITGVTINASPNDIYGEAFKGEDISSISINNDDSEIGVNLNTYAFRYCNAKSIYVSNVHNFTSLVFFGTNNLTKLYFKKAKYIDSGFRDAVNIAKFRVDNAEYIRTSGMFSKATKISTIIILNSDSLPIFKDINGFNTNPFSGLNPSAKLYVHANMLTEWREKFEEWGLTNEIIEFNEEDGIWEN